MDWLLDHWMWILGAIILLFILKGKAQPRQQVSDAQARMMVETLIEAFDDILNSFLGGHYSRMDIRKIAIGMVAVMAAEKISLDRMKNNPDLVIAVAAKSAALLTQQGQISSYA